MKIKLFNIVFLAVLTFSLASCAQGTKEAKVTTSTAAQVKELISPTDLNSKLGDIQLVDVRTPGEYTSGYIKGAININSGSSSFIADMSKLDKDKAIYIYCRSGSRSGRAASKLQKAGFTKIYDLQGGIMNWNRSNLETVK